MWCLHAQESINKALLGGMGGGRGGTYVPSLKYFKYGLFMLQGVSHAPVGI